MPTAESIRSREVYKYYQPSSATDPSVSTSSSAFDEALPSPASSRPTRDTNFTTQQSFSDTALTAFAQLIALRLESQRAIVSLIDHENEYFLAESTSSFSHVDDEGARNAWLSISGIQVPRFASLCEATLHHAGHPSKLRSSVVLVPDLRLDENLNKLDSVTGPPYLRFYCGVPLTNKNGVTIGCVYVVDDRPRASISEPQAQYLHIMAETIMAHLENIRAKEDITRVTQMSQALHAFIEGDGTMDGGWQRLRKSHFTAGAAAIFHWETNNEHLKEILEGSSLSIPLSAGIDMGHSRVHSPLQASSPLEHIDSKRDSYYNFNSSPWSSSSDIPQLPDPLRSVPARIDNVLKSASAGKVTTQFIDGFSSLLRMTFSRASNLIREGMEVDGAVFFDAPEKFYQSRSKLESRLERPRQSGSVSSSESDGEIKEARRDVRPGPRPHATFKQYPSSHHVSHSGSSSSEESPSRDDIVKSDVLGFSTSESSSLEGQTMETATTFSAISQKLMASLVRRYPQGKLFVFDEDGPINRPKHSLSVESSRTMRPSSQSEGERDRHKARKRAEVHSLLAAFPGARQIFFVPLLDSISGCFIGSFAWSTSATRVFSVENHLSYLVAFGHSVMGEVMTLNTLSADRAKGDFISNVSHELRSPLHGVLASVEFLADTTLDGFQRNLVDTVGVCGRTLLDTVEHILDFTKIKKYGQESMQPIGVVANLDISAVIEEVLEGVYAGFEFNGLSSEGLADTTLSGARNASTSETTMMSNTCQRTISNGLVTVILDIDFRENWNFPTVPGTWRRLTMNLFGNALKYTKSGWIKVALQAKSIPPHSLDDGSGEVARTAVTMTVSDSGQGMTSDFVEKKLFMPFSQEDVTAPGTGLGMSIVKQIVDLSKGTIEIKSELGVGTSVLLTLPLDECLPQKENIESSSSTDQDSEDAIAAIRRRAKGRSVTIRGFESRLTDSDLQREAQSCLKASVVKYATDWLNLSVVPTDATAAAEIIITDEVEFFSTSKSEGKIPDQTGCLLVICGNGARHNIYGSPLDTNHLVEFVGKPFGPHRLAKALLRCLDAEDARTQHMSTPGDPSATHAIPIHQSHALSKEDELIPTGITESDGLPVPTRRSRNRVNKIGHLTSDISSGSSGTNDTTSDSISNSGSPNSSLGTLDETPPHQPKMLLVEDNPVNMMLLSTYMTKKNWEFEKARNGLEALEAFQRRPQGFDVVFMDVSMPIMTGYESTRAIRALEYQRRTHPQASVKTPETSAKPTSQVSEIELEPEPCKFTNSTNKPALIIALTGFSSKEDQEMASESGMDVFMTKPVRFKEVGKILEGFMTDRGN